jgi:hypothetical protein
MSPILMAEELSQARNQREAGIKKGDMFLQNVD